MDALELATPLVGSFFKLLRLYGNLNTEKVRGFGMYENFKQETDFVDKRIKLSTAALLHSGFFVPSLVRYLGGTHTGAHRNIQQIRRDLTPSVDPDLLEEVIALFTRGAPNVACGYSSNDNFMAYYRYRNHHSCDDFQDFFEEVMVKDSRRGNTILVDPLVLLFIPHLHLTPQAMVDVINPWKDARPVFDSLFRPAIWCHAINDWIDKETEGEVFFPGSLLRFLIWIWNLRILYPTEAIYLCDDDITNAFHS